MASGRLSHRALVLAVGGGLQSLGQVLVGLVLVRLLDQATYGTYRQAWLVLNSVTPFLLLGVPAGLYFFVPGTGEAGRRSQLVRGYGILAVSGTVFAAGVFALAPALADLFRNPELVGPLRATSLYALTILPSFALFHFLIAVGRAGRGVVLNLVFFAIQAALILGLALAGRSLTEIFLAVGFWSSIRLLHVMWETTRVTRGAWSGEAGGDIREFLKYSVPVGLSNLALALAQRLDKFVVSAFMPVARFAEYSVGAVEFPGIVLISTAANTVMRPHISRLHHEGDRAAVFRFWREAYRRQSLVILPLAVCLAVVADDFVRLLYTDAYRAATPVFRLYLALALFRMAPPEVILTSVGRSGLVLRGLLGALVVNLGLTLAMIGPLGVMGPPLATILATAGLMAYYARVSANYMRVPWSALIPLDLLVPGLAVALGAGVVTWFLLPGDWVPGNRLLAGLVLYLAVWIVLALVARIIRPEDRRLLRDWLSLRFLRDV